MPLPFTVALPTVSPQLSCAWANPIELLLLVDDPPEAAPGDLVYGTLVLETERTVVVDGVSVVLTASPNWGATDEGVEFARHSLDAGRLQEGRHEFAFELIVPAGVASYEGELFDMAFRVEGVVDHYNDPLRTFVPIKITREGALVVRPEFTSLVTTPQRVGFLQALMVSGVSGALAGVLVGMLFSGTAAILAPVVLTLLGTVFGVAWFATSNAERIPDVEDIEFSVEPTKTGLTANIVVKIRSETHLKSVVFSVESREVLAATESRALTSRPVSAHAVTLATDLHVQAEQVVEFQHEYEWSDDDLPSLRAGATAIRWEARVVVDAVADKPLEVRFPLDVSIAPVSDGPIVAQEPVES